MTIQKAKPPVQRSDKLLSAQEQALCKKFTRREAPYNQRASMLLAMNANNTRAQAAEAAGMSTGQVKYWMARFRKERMAIFPEDVKAAGKVKTAARAKGVAAAPEAKAEKKGGKGKKKDKKGKKGKKGKKKSGKGKKN